MTPELTRTHELLGRVRARLGVLRPVRGVARRTLFRAVLFATFVAAVSLVGRAWALARVPAPPESVADRLPPTARTATFTFGHESAQGVAPVHEMQPSQAIAAASSGALGPPASTPAALAGEAAVNLNSATAAELETLPYVGPKRAQAILALRTKLGRFKSVDELLKVKGIGRGTLKRMRARVTVGPA